MRTEKDSAVNEELRAEVANLRREMDRLREEQEQQRLTQDLNQYPASEAPPEYTPDV